MIARRLQSEQANNEAMEANPYLSWINNYVADDYTAAVEKGCGIPIHFHRPFRMLTMYEALIEKHAVHQSPHRIEELIVIFIHATKASAPVISSCSFSLTTVYPDGDWFLGYGGCCVEL